MSLLKYEDDLRRKKELEIMLGSSFIEFPNTSNNEKLTNYLEYLIYKLNSNFIHVYTRINKLQDEIEKLKMSQNKIDNI